MEFTEWLMEQKDTGLTLLLGIILITSMWIIGNDKRKRLRSRGE